MWNLGWIISRSVSSSFLFNRYHSFCPHSSSLVLLMIFVQSFLTNDFATLPQPWQRCKGVDWWGALLLNANDDEDALTMRRRRRRRTLDMMNVREGWQPEEALCSRGPGDTTPLPPWFSHNFQDSPIGNHNWWQIVTDNWPPDWRRQEQRKASCEVELSPRASLSLLPPEDPHPASCHNNNNNVNNDNNVNDNKNNNNNNNKNNSKIKSEDGDLGEAFESNASRRQGCVGLVLLSFALLNQPLIVMMIRMMILTMMMVNVYVLCLR